MSITADHGNIVFHCDGKSCHEAVETGERGFDDALAQLKAKNWKWKLEGKWRHLCPECAEEERNSPHRRGHHAS